MERVWGGRRLQTLYGKRLPPAVPIGESWEIVDRADAQSVVHTGPLAGRTLHELWETRRAEIFGDVPDGERFPLLIKILDAREKLSVQVHPPAKVARELGGEPKTEFWYVAEAVPGADLYVGLTSETTRALFEEALARGEIGAQLHRIDVQSGDSMFLPSGRVHAIGGGNVIFEIQQNSDTTFRVFDWNRLEGGEPRKLHLEESLRCIDFEDKQPALAEQDGESLVRHESFHVEKWQLDRPRPAGASGQFAICCCLRGTVQCGEMRFRAGDFFLVPATLANLELSAGAEGAELLRVTTGQAVH